MIPASTTSSPTESHLREEGTASEVLVDGNFLKARRDVVRLPESLDGRGGGAEFDREFLLQSIGAMPGERLTLAQLGIATEEFSGRRFRSQFYIGLPGDFYSDAYGAATLYLDATGVRTVR